ncbi:MAG: SDR family NAD(P)-dependent oxidoreductase [Austwickia sp.]|nr:SDR family NAD(P)-dependent oxidoreductase [Austwickia sp.]MBK9102532.1 SDR family NAD(P)-dependent oxidoreductase [Austwickia sp.]
MSTRLSQSHHADPTTPTKQPLAPYDFTRGRAVVTGAGSGLGAALAHGLAARGSALVLLDTDADALTRTSDALRADHPGLAVVTYAVDLADSAATDRAAADIRARYDDLTLLIHAATEGVTGPFGQSPLPEVDHALAVTLSAVLHLTSAFLPDLKRHHGSHLVTVAAADGLLDGHGQAASAAGPSGVLGFTEALRPEVAGQTGVTIVHLLAPTTTEGATEADADQILEAVRRRRPRVVLGAAALAPTLVQRTLPRTADRLAERGARLVQSLTPRTIPAGPGPERARDLDPVPEEPGTARLTVGGRVVRYRETGSPDAPPVVLIHGLTRSLADWSSLHHLLGDEYRVISLDLPGTGRSDPLEQPHTLANLSAAVVDVMDALSVTAPAHLCGNSLGGAVALKIAVTHPGRVRDLALFNSAGFGTEVALALRLAGLRGLLPYPAKPSWRRSSHMERLLYFDKSLATPERIGHAYTLSKRPWALRVLLETGSDLGDIRGTHQQWRTDLLTRAAAVNLPTLVIWGLDDEVLPARHLDAVPTFLPNARTHLFPRCGHMPMVERAEDSAALLRDFWSTSTTPATPAVPERPETPTAKG